MLFTITVTFAKVKFCFIPWLKSQFSILGRIPKDTERFSRHFSTKSAPAQTRRTRTQSFHWNDLKINLWDIYHIFVKNELKCPLIISTFSWGLKRWAYFGRCAYKGKMFLFWEVGSPIFDFGDIGSLSGLDKVQDLFWALTKINKFPITWIN